MVHRTKHPRFFVFFLHYRFSTARGLGIHMGKLCTPAHLETNTHHQPDKHLLNRSNPINKFDDFFNNWDCLDRIDRKSSGELHWVAHILLLPPSVAWLPPGIGKLGKCLSRGCVTMKLLFLSFFFYWSLLDEFPRLCLQILSSSTCYKESLSLREIWAPYRLHALSFHLVGFFSVDWVSCCLWLCIFQFLYIYKNIHFTRTFYWVTFILIFFMCCLHSI